MQVKVLGKVYPFPSKQMTLGDQSLVKREFGYVAGEDLNLNDPDHMQAFLFTVMREKDPNASTKSILQSVQRVREIEILDDDGNPLTELEDDDESESDPTPAPAKRKSKKAEHAEDDPGE